MDNGDWALCGEPGQRVLVFSCHHGFRLHGPEQVACSPRGGRFQPPVCRGQCSSAPASPPNLCPSDRSKRKCGS